MRTIKLINSELKDVIDPILKSKKTNEAITKYLLLKRKSLCTFRENYQKLFEAKKLDTVTYCKILNQMKGSHFDVSKQAQNSVDVNRYV